MSNWKLELEEAVKLDAITDPEKLKNFISVEYEFLEKMARKIAFAIHDIGFVIARSTFSYYWTDMSSSVESNDETSGYSTKIKIEREMSIPFYHTIFVLVTNEGIKINGKYLTVSSDGNTLGDDGLNEDYRSVLSLSLEEVKAIEVSHDIRTVVDRVMEGFVESYKQFLTSIGKHPS